MNLLASRKKMLVAESELNRAQLVQDWQTMANDVQVLMEQAATFTSLASAAASLVTGLLSFRRKMPAPVAEKSSWLQTLLKGVQLAVPLWLEFRARPK
jgi:hypothetical protein